MYPARAEFLPPFRTLSGKGKSEVHHIRDERRRNKKAQIGRNPIVRQENGETQYRTDPETRSRDFSEPLRK